jgi:hypothetical protein
MPGAKIYVYHISLDYGTFEAIDPGDRRDGHLVIHFRQRLQVTVHQDVGNRHLGMCIECPIVFRHAITFGLVRLGGDVADEDLWHRRSRDSLADGWQ